MINFIIWIIAGALVGWVASLIMRTNKRQGLITDIIVGIVGAFLAGYFLSPLFNVSTINEGNFSIPALLVSLGGAIILLAISKLFRNVGGFLLVLIIILIIYTYFTCWPQESTSALLLRSQGIAIPEIDPSPPVSPKWRRQTLPGRWMRLGSVRCRMRCMTRVYLADAKPEERSALRLLLLDLKMEVAGEAADWATTLAQAPVSRTDMLLIDWDLLPNSPTAALEELRKACPAALVIILISHLDARQQAALSAGADAFISKGETPERVAERLRVAAASVRTCLMPSG